MNDLNVWIIVGASFVTILSFVSSKSGKQTYKDNAAFFESSNHELREQVASFKQDKTDLVTAVATLQAESKSKDEIIKQLKPFSAVVTTMSENHTQVMTALADVTKLITGKVDGHK